MNTLLRATALASLLVVGSGCSTLRAASRPADSSDSLVLRAHFIGSSQLFADPNGLRLKELWGLPGSVALRNEAVERFSHLPVRLFAGSSASGLPDHAAVLRPLLEDILANEAYADFQATPEMVLAIRLPDARAKAWDTALKQAASGWKLGTPAPVN